MSPASYVLLLIGCWFLLASTTLWGILRVTRRHYLELPDTENEPTPVPDIVHNEPTDVRSPLLEKGIKWLGAIARLPWTITPALLLQRRTSTD
ncbi:hypothetical protein HG264_17335 [Pseudomonas sp. gcc21]|uniref:hypothetical protein n=1 Tax=Pseudomonas sp. gcc21 TaxID=2726989 RepID=UPI001452975D|nr:hypothetical protein [Pseudomonas sp. gcc21]QJD60514.1 hypothetical protein HG264_17335 [Pseudomonas sp. gcc21]